MRISVDLNKDPDNSFDYCFENFVENFLDGDADGLGRVDQKIDNMRDAFARLLEHLVGKGSVDAEALSVILASRAVKFVHDIEVISEHNIQGRGLIFAVEGDPTIQVGHFVRVEGGLWLVRGIEYSGFSKAIGLLVREMTDE